MNQRPFIGDKATSTTLCPLFSCRLFDGQTETGYAHEHLGVLKKTSLLILKELCFTFGRGLVFSTCSELPRLACDLLISIASFPIVNIGDKLYLHRNHNLLCEIDTHFFTLCASLQLYNLRRQISYIFIPSFCLATHFENRTTNLITE